MKKICALLCLFLVFSWGALSQNRYYNFGDFVHSDVGFCVFTCQMDSVSQAGDTLSFLCINVYNYRDTLFLPPLLSRDESDTSVFAIHHFCPNFIEPVHELVFLAGDESYEYIIPMSNEQMQHGVSIHFPSMSKSSVTIEYEYRLTYPKDFVDVPAFEIRKDGEHYFVNDALFQTAKKNLHIEINLPDALLLEKMQKPTTKYIRQ